MIIEFRASDLSVINKLFQIFTRYEKDLPEPMIKEIEALAIESGV